MGRKKMTIRTARAEDVPLLEALDREIYTDNGAADEGCIARRVETFPEGVLVWDELGIIRAAMYLRPLLHPIDPKNPLTWKEAENNGDFSPPTEQFSYIYGVGYVGTGNTSDVMLLAGIRQCIALNIRAGFFGSRIPTLSTHFNNKPSADQVRDYVDSGEDWEIRMYHKAGVLGLEMVRDDHGRPVVIQDYFDDPESYDYGVLWRLNNRWRGPLRFIGVLIFSMLIIWERFFNKN